MIKEEIHGTKKVFSQYCFHHPLNLVWRILTNSTLISFLQPNLQNFTDYYIAYQTQSIRYQIGSKFKVQIGEQLVLFIEIDDIIEKTIFVKLNGKVQSIIFSYYAFTACLILFLLKKIKRFLFAITSLTIIAKRAPNFCNLTRRKTDINIICISAISSQQSNTSHLI